MLRSRASTDFEQCRAMLKLLRAVAHGSGRRGMKDVYSHGNISPSISPSKIWLGTAVGIRKPGCAEESLRTEVLEIAASTKRHPHGFKWKKAKTTPLNSPNITPESFPSKRREKKVKKTKEPESKDSKRDLARHEDPFDTITDKIPERPVTVAEGASYSVVILLGLAVAGAAAYAVFKELVFEPKEYKVFGKALNRVQNDNQVSVRLGSPITGYGQESRNRAARQRISNRAWTDEAGIERVEVMFHIRGPAGAGKVYSEMFKDPEDKTWKYTYLIVDVTSPSPARLMLESYVPPLSPLNAM